MDWNRLWRLNFGQECPERFLIQFCGLLPNLKSFGCGITQGNQDLVSDFVLVIDELEELKLYNFDYPNSDFPLSSIIAHGKTLRRLFCISPSRNREHLSLAWSKDQLSELKGSCQKLENLTLDGIRENRDRDQETLHILAEFPALSRLKLHIEIGPCDIEFLDAKIGQPAVQRMFHYLQQRGSNLAQLEVEFGKFTRNLGGRGARYRSQSFRERYTVTCTASNVSSNGL
ncbi:hypothetical protein C8J56DRAFT_457902 [Mycena floridula]|nr:hypothetical protein C8J56DRAFT_457902 [Mycena floridula]